MFRPGKVLKVKVELSPDMVGFGRATILEADRSRIYLQLKTSKGKKRVLPKGTKVWFVSDTPSNPFNGLWSTTIVSSKIIQGKTAMECHRPKFEALIQRRKQRRVAVSCPVRLEGEQWKEIVEVVSRNLSRSGLGIEIAEDCAAEFQSNHNLDVVMQSPVGDISFTARVVQSRYNWLANRTDVGLEFVKISDESVETLDRLLVQLGGRPRHAPEGKDKPRGGKEGPGPLSGWLKSTKDNISFIKMREHEVLSVSPEDIEDMDDVEDLNDDDNGDTDGDTRESDDK